MNPVEQIKNAALGWLDVVFGRPGGPDRFDNSRSGLAVALVFYLAMVILTIYVQATTLGLPTPAQLVVGILVNGLPLLALALVIGLTIVALRPGVSFNALMVPGSYALAFLLVIGLPFSIFGAEVSPALIGVLGYLLYRAARIIAGLNIATSIAFAALSVIALVALPLGLYMLIAPGPGPI